MIVFKKISIKNFLSIGNKPVELELNTHNITSVSGENGASKSAICIDSIFYALYGKSFRKVSLPKLINSYNKKGLWVELTFSVNQNEYRIVRGMKPNIFEIYVNNELKPPMANVKDYQTYLINHVLKMDEKTFRQLVVIGSSSYTPFMNLTAAERRVVIEQLLRIDIFSTMSTITKTYVSETNSLLTELSHQADTLALKIEMQKKNDEALLKQIEDDIKSKHQDVEHLKGKRNEVECRYQDAMSKIDKNYMEELKNKSKKTKEDWNTLEQLRIKKVSQGEHINKLMSFFEKNNVCPTCTQKLEDSFVAEKMKELREKKTKQDSDLKLFDDKIHELQMSYKHSVDTFNRIIQELNKAEEIKREVSSIDNTIQFAVKQIISLQARLEKERNTVSEDVTSFYEELSVVRNSLNECQKKKEALSIIQELLKDDGVKSIIIKSYLNIINALISKYLNIIGYNVVFELDENFNETIKSKHMEVYEYNNFSEGERLRIDSAIMFAFRDLSKIQSSISTNILILDEFDRGTLDTQGFESIVEILRNCRDENVFIISHATDYFGAIADRNLVAVKKNNFSELNIL
jgi:DNA repair exonuclease SbcCD ATPase subunit